MLEIRIFVSCPAGQAIGVKEAIAQDLERYGDVRVAQITVISDQTQLSQFQTERRRSYGAQMDHNPTAHRQRG